jgi:hypothetical protein
VVAEARWATVTFGIVGVWYLIRAARTLPITSSTP